MSFELIKDGEPFPVTVPPEPEVIDVGGPLHPTACLFEMTLGLRRKIADSFKKERFYSIRIGFGAGWWNYYDNVLFCDHFGKTMALVPYFPDGSKHFMAYVSRDPPVPGMPYLRWIGSETEFNDKYSFFVIDSLQERVERLEKMIFSNIKKEDVDQEFVTFE